MQERKMPILRESTRRNRTKKRREELLLLPNSSVGVDPPGIMFFFLFFFSYCFRLADARHETSWHNGEQWKADITKGKSKNYARVN